MNFKNWILFNIMFYFYKICYFRTHNVFIYKDSQWGCVYICKRKKTQSSKNIFFTKIKSFPYDFRVENQGETKS